MTLCVLGVRSLHWQTLRMNKIKVAVLGTGSLGQHHVRIYSELHAAGQVELTGIFDTHTETARKIAEKHKLRVFASSPRPPPPATRSTSSRPPPRISTSPNNCSHRANTSSSRNR